MRRALIGLAIVSAALAATIAPVAGAPATNDPLLPAQWGLAKINATAAWPSSTGKGLLIGVVDSGVDLTHEDLAAKIAGSTNCVGANGDPTQCHGSAQDDFGHGTAVAGIAAAVTGNGKGIAGMAPDSKLLVAKALDNTGTGSVPDIAAGIHWVVDHGAKVVNLSLGDPSFGATKVFVTPIADAIEYAWSKGSIPVLSSGNALALGFSGGNYGNVDAVIVGATGRDGAVASYSTPTGSAKWALLAPGGSGDGTPADDIMSTAWMAGQPNAYKSQSGTGMAAPLVSGTLALLLAQGMTPASAVSRLLTTVDTKVACGPDSANCHGQVNAGAATATPATGPTTTTVPSHTAPPTTTTSLLPPAPAQTVAPPAIMSAGRAPGTTVAPHASGGPPAAASPSPILKDSHAAAIQPVSHHSGGSLIWFIALAGIFVLAGAVGVFWFVRVSPDVE